MKQHRSLISLVLFLLLAFSSALWAGTQWTPEFCMQFRTVQGVDLSPDGQWIVYGLREALTEGEKSEYRTHLWLLSRDGDTHFQLTRGDQSCTSPAFSPDGQYLAFATPRSGSRQIWALSLKGGEAWQVSEAENGVGAFQWSPDGSRLAYLMRDPETEAEKKDKKEKRDVILLDQNYKYSHIYTIPFEKNEEGKRPVQRVTAGDYHVADFDWHPDGSTFAFTWVADPTLETAFIEKDIAIVPADSGQVIRLIARPGIDASPKYSPDGKYIAYTSQNGNPTRIGPTDHYVMSSMGGDAKKLAETPERQGTRFQWAPDGKSLYINEFIGLSRHLISLPVNGKPWTRITSDEGIYGDFVFDKRGNNVAFTYEDIDQPVNMFTSGVKKFKPVKLTDLHSHIDMPDMGKTVPLKWTSKDGLEIEGLLTYPVNYQDGDKVPLVLNVHGGPAGNFARNFSARTWIYMIQYFAQKGYAVLRPNPRGSIGYGVDFRMANIQDWGFGDYEDCMSGVDKVIDMGVAHADSLCLMGWSYGGYMTSWMVTQTDRFKAASMGAGLPNLISMVSTTDIKGYLREHLGGDYFNDYETYEKHSAIYHIKNVTTPTQVIHGKEDFRVPFDQGLEFYNGLKRVGVPTEMVVYPRTPHGPREPKFTIDVSYRIMKWFEKHLREKDLELYPEKCEE